MCAQPLRAELTVTLNVTTTVHQALRAELEKRKTGGGGGGGGACRTMEDESNARRVHELTARAGQQQAQIDRQEQIIIALRDQLQRQPAAAPRDDYGGFDGGGSSRSSSRPGSGARQPQDLIVARAENTKLRELVGLLQDKLRDLEGRG